MRTVLLIGLLLVVAESGQKKSAMTPAPAAVTLDDHGDPKGLHRHRRWSEKIGQGAQPEGEEAFRNLQALGYTTILSVDGSTPRSTSRRSTASRTRTCRSATTGSRSRSRSGSSRP